MQASHLHRNIHTALLIDAEHDVRGNKLLETAQFRFHGVRAHGHVRDPVVAAVVRDGTERRAADDNLRIGNRPAGRGVAYVAFDLACAGDDAGLGQRERSQ